MFCEPLGFPALDFSKLVADGGIPNELYKILDGPPPTDKIDKPTRGQRFEKILDPYGEEIWVEIRKLLPCEFMIWQIQYRTRKNSNNETISDVGGGSSFGILGAGAGILADTIANSRRTGGISFSEAKFAVQVVESEVRYDMAIPVTRIRGKGTLQLPGQVLAVLSVTDEPLNLTPDQKLRVGRNKDRQKQGIISNPHVDGQVDVDIMDEIFESRAEFDSRNRFETIVRDERIHWFRADNNTSESYDYAWQNNDENFNDLTTDTIEIDATGLINEQAVYVTAEIVKKKRFRTLVSHKGKTFDYSTLGSATPNFFEFGANFKAFNFQSVKWRVPKAWKKEPVSLPDAFRVNMLDEEDRSWDEVEGWRISEVMLGKDHDLITADQRGVIQIDKAGTLVRTLLGRGDLSEANAAWFDAYLEERGLTDADISASELIYTGAMFDLSEHVSSAITDQEKVPYDRHFAMSLQARPRILVFQTATSSLVTLAVAISSTFAAPSLSRSIRFRSSSARIRARHVAVMTVRAFTTLSTQTTCSIPSYPRPLRNC
ncbi:MAG: hypothetical protein HC888_01835 [Candidatus Competibacteraceae bacterium]|nr:hypothetical protein [Candidatus Competibacteraceae bacterium]